MFTTKRQTNCKKAAATDVSIVNIVSGKPIKLMEIPYDNNI